MQAILFNGIRKSILLGTTICISGGLILHGNNEKISGEIPYENLSPEEKTKVNAFLEQ